MNPRCEAALARKVRERLAGPRNGCQELERSLAVLQSPHQPEWESWLRQEWQSIDRLAWKVELHRAAGGSERDLCAHLSRRARAQVWWLLRQASDVPKRQAGHIPSPTLQLDDGPMRRQQAAAAAWREDRSRVRGQLQALVSERENMASEASAQDREDIDEKIRRKEHELELVDGHVQDSDEILEGFRRSRERLAATKVQAEELDQVFSSLYAVINAFSLRVRHDLSWWRALGPSRAVMTFAVVHLAVFGIGIGGIGYLLDGAWQQSGLFDSRGAGALAPLVLGAVCVAWAVGRFVDPLVERSLANWLRSSTERLFEANALLWELRMVRGLRLRAERQS